MLKEKSERTEQIALVRTELQSFEEKNANLVKQLENYTKETFSQMEKQMKQNMEEVKSTLSTLSFQVRSFWQ